MLDLSGWRRNWALLQYGDYWRTHRRLFHQHFHRLAVPQYRPKQEKAVRRLLPLLVGCSGDFAQHIRYMAGALILDVVYAFDIQPGDPRIEIVEKAVHTTAHMINAGIYLVEVFPILRHLPTWLPGTYFKQQAAEWKVLVDAMFEVPYNQLKSVMRTDGTQPCFGAALLSDTGALEVPDRDELFMSLTGTVYAGGSDTTVATLTTFVLAMVLYPEVQTYVQQELDRVVGRERLPDMGDQAALPRVAAVVQEIFRWHPPFPLIPPHRTAAADIYEGQHIPSGSTVMLNAWAILHDAETYPDPSTFRPQRFLTPDGAALRTDVPRPSALFGAGRRACPGARFAADTLFLAAAHMLAVFTIGRAAGAGAAVGERFSPHILSFPEPFAAAFTLRHAGAERLVREAAALADL